MPELLPPDFLARPVAAFREERPLVRPRDDIFFRVPAAFLAGPFLDTLDLVVVRLRVFAPDRLVADLRAVGRVTLDFRVVGLRPAAFFAAGFFFPELDGDLVTVVVFPREVAADVFLPALSPAARLVAEAVFPAG